MKDTTCLLTGKEILTCYTAIDRNVRAPTYLVRREVFSYNELFNGHYRLN